MPKPKEKEEPKRLYTGEGQSTVRGLEGTRPILYVIKWEKTQLDYTLKNGPSSGRLEDVSGDLYRDGKKVSHFTAKTGFADQEKKQLRLEGSVRVVSQDPKATMSCDRMVWQTDELLAKAYGGVTINFKVEQPGPAGTTVEADGGKIGPMDELWCLPDLGKAGTPGFDWAPDIKQSIEKAKKEGRKP